MCHSAVRVWWGGIQGEAGNLHPEQSPRHLPHAQDGARVRLQGFVPIFPQFWKGGRRGGEETLPVTRTGVKSIFCGQTASPSP